PAAGSSSYIQNGSGLQTGASLNIDGNGLFGGTVSAFGLGSFGSVSATTVSATSYTNNFASMLLSSPAPGQLQIGDFSTVNTVIDGFSTTLNGIMTTVTGNASLNGATTTINGNTTVNGTTTTINSNTVMNGSSTTINGNATIGGNAFSNSNSLNINSATTAVTSNLLTISGNTTFGGTLTAPTVKTTTISSGVAVVVDSSGKLGIASSSSRRFKDKIRPMANASEGLF